MAMDRTPNRFHSIFETLDARTLFADAYSLSQFPNGSGYDSIQKRLETADASYVVGLFSGRVDFNLQSGVSALTARGDTDAYLAKYNKSGQLQWVTAISGSFTDRAMTEYDKRDMLTNPRRITQFLGKVGEQPRAAGEYIFDIADDAAGNVIVTGSFTGTVTIGGHQYTSDDSINEKYYDGYIAKFNSANGAAAWVQQISGPFDEYPASVGLDKNGNVFVGGYYTRQVDIDGSRRVRMLTTDGRDAGFVARYSSDGVYSWAYQFTSKTGDRELRNAVNDIAVTGNGEVYFAGTFGDEARFNPSQPKSVTESVGETDAVVGKLNRKGALSWIQTTGDERADGNTTLTLDGAGNLYTAGYFSDRQDVDPRSNVTNFLTPASDDGSDRTDFSDLLISKFTLDGVPVWQGQLGGENIELVSDIIVSGDGAINVSGSFFGTADFAPGRNTFNLSSTQVVNDDDIKDLNTNFGREDTYDWFHVRISPRGKFIDAVKIGGADDDYSSGMNLSGNDVVITGRIVSAVGDRDDRDEQGVTVVRGVLS